MTAFFYPDVSNVGDAGLVLQPGTVAVSAKSSEGTSFQDPSYNTFKTQALMLGSVFFAYHWTWYSNPAREISNLMSMVQDTPFMWDVENLTRIQSVPELVDLTRRAKAAGGNPRLCYLPRWYWSGHMGFPDLRPLEDEGLRFVSSNYTTYSDDGPGWQPYGNITPYVWQYTNHLSYGGRQIDFNACKDTLANFREFLYPTAPVVTPVSNPTKDFIVTHWQTIQRGSKGSRVSIWQGILIGHGYPLTVDGDFGPDTQAKTVMFQRDKGITQDGIVGPVSISFGVLDADYSRG